MQVVSMRVHCLRMRVNIQVLRNLVQRLRSRLRDHPAASKMFSIPRFSLSVRGRKYWCAYKLNASRWVLSVPRRARTYTNDSQKVCQTIRTMILLLW